MQKLVTYLRRGQRIRVTLPNGTLPAGGHT
jgi:hypothetical protein